MMPPVQQTRVGVIGVGTMGSQVLHQLATRGVEVTGFERFDPGHERGAAGGQTRIFRVAYKEGARYVPLLRAAREAWQDLGVQAGRTLLEPIGALSIGSATDPDIRTVLDVTEQCGLDVRGLDHARLSQHRLFEDDLALLDAAGGLLHPHLAVRETAKLAERAGARVLREARVEDIEETATGVEVRYRRAGSTAVQRFDQVVVCTGPWIRHLVPALAPAVEIRRAVLSWFPVDDPVRWSPARFPVGIRRSGAENSFSFFPDVGDGIKINLHIPKSVVDDPDRVDPEVEREHVDLVSTVVGRCLHDLPARPTTVRTYAEGYTADNHGIIGRVPAAPNVLAMGGFSGHGFKLAPVLGSAAADLVLTGDTRWPVDHLALSRLESV